MYKFVIIDNKPNNFKTLLCIPIPSFLDKSDTLDNLINFQASRLIYYNKK